MADELGTAVLTLVIDQEAFKKSLNQAKAQLTSELGGAVNAPGGRGANAGTRRGGGGPTAELRAAAQLLRLRNSINILEANGVNVSRLRARLSDLEAAAADKQFKRVRDQGEALRQSVSAEQNRLRVSTLVTRELERQRKEQLRIAKENAVPVSGVTRTPGLPAFQFPGSPGIRGGRVAGGGGGGGNPPDGPTNDAIRRERQLARERERAAKATQRAAERESKRIETERKQEFNRRRDIISNIAIGAGFPLLFGQGIGAAAGGALGGGLGGALGGTAGFAGSIVGTALGAAFDTALQKAQELARGLDDPIKNFDALRQAALLSSRAVEKNAEALIASGREEEAAALIRADLLKTFGTPEGAAEFTAATDELSRAWSQATVSLTQFVAGPLAKFLRGVSLFLGGGEAANAAADVRRAQQLARSSPERRQQLEQLARQRGGRLTEELTIAGAPSVPVFRDFLQLNGQLTQEQRNQKELTDAISGAYERTVQFNRLNLDLINASARGNELEANSIEKKLVALERTRKLNTLSATAPQAQRDQIEQEAAAKLADLEAKRVGIQDRINAEAFSELQARQQIQRSISNTLQLLGAQSGQYRDTLRTIQQISGTIDEARQKEAQIGFQIGQARIAGREQEASRLVDQQVTAAAETRQRLVEGALALTEAGDKLRNDVRDAALSLARVRGGEQGLNRFLSPGLQQQRAEQTNRLLQPFFQEAVGRLRQLVPTADISGFALTGATTADLNKNIIDFIQAVNEEFQATQGFVNAQQSLEQINQALVDVNSQLVGATNALAAKDWVVAVNVVNQAGGASTINTVNSLS